MNKKINYYVIKMLITSFSCSCRGGTRGPRVTRSLSGMGDGGCRTGQYTRGSLSGSLRGIHASRGVGTRHAGQYTRGPRVTRGSGGWGTRGIYRNTVPRNAWDLSQHGPAWDCVWTYYITLLLDVVVEAVDTTPSVPSFKQHSWSFLPSSHMNRLFDDLFGQNTKCL